MASQADKQPRHYQISLLVDDDEFDTDLLAAVAAEGGAPVSELKTAGTFQRHLQAVVMAALEASFE
jgi:hypothetical protein